jgi:hypothetical protein
MAQLAGHAALQVVAPPPGHRVGAPAAHSLKLQFCVPASLLGQRKMHAAPASQVPAHGPASQTKSQLLPGPQRQLPFAHSPVQRGLLPSQST